MKAGVRIVKRGRANSSQGSAPDQDEKTGRHTEREIVSTVQSWITELAQRRRADEHTARMRFFAAVH